MNDTTNSRVAEWRSDNDDEIARLLWKVIALGDDLRSTLAAMQVRKSRALKSSLWRAVAAIERVESNIHWILCDPAPHPRLRSDAAEVLPVAEAR